MNKLAPSQVDPNLSLTFAELCYVILEVGLGKSGRAGWTFPEIDKVMPSRKLGERAFGAATVRAWYKGINLPRQRLGEFKEFFLKDEDHHDNWKTDIDGAYQHSVQIRTNGGELFHGDTARAKALITKYRSLKIGRIEFAAASGLADYRDIEISEAPKALRRRVLDRPVTRQSLQAGYYMPRKGVEEKISAELEKFILRAENKGTFGVFWIGGRSGDGKSTLLARTPLTLLDRTATDYIYVDGLNSLAALDFSEPHWLGRRVALVLNDLFASPTDKDITLIRHFAAQSRFALESGLLNGVTIATCGPDPEFDLFRQHFSETDILHFRTPDPSYEEQKMLANWFGYQENFVFRESDLLVEFLFCLEVGMSLSQFAISFRERLNNLPGSFELIQLIVTSSSFGLPAPLSIFSNDLGTKDVISRLAEEDQRHFSFEETDYGNSTLFSHNAISKSLIYHWMASAVTTNKIEQAVSVVSDLFNAIDNEEVFAFRLIERIRLHSYHLTQICREDVVVPTAFLKQLAARVEADTLGWSNVQAGYASNIALERDREAGVQFLKAMEEIGPLTAPPSNGEAVLLAKTAEIASFVGEEFDELRQRSVEGLLSQRLGGWSAYALGHLVTRRVAAPELVEQWMAFFPDVPRPPELICAATPSSTTTQEARKWLHENISTQQSAKVAGWIVDHQNTVEEVTEAIGEWLGQSNIHGHFSVVAQLLKDFPNSPEIYEIAIDWVQRNRSVAGTESVVARLIRTAPLSKETLFAVTGYIRLQVTSGVREGTLIKRLEPVLLAAMSVWPRRTNAAGICSSKLVSTVGRSDQALKLHAKNISSASDPQQISDLHNLTLSLVELNFDEPYMASHLATYVKSFPSSPEVSDVAYRWLKESKCRRLGGGVISALVGKTNVTVRRREEIWHWIRNHSEDRGIHNTIWMYLRQFHRDAAVRKNVLSWLMGHEHFFGALVLRSHIARSLPELSKEFGSPNFETNEALLDVPRIELARLRFDFLQDEDSGRALEAAIMSSPNEASSINAMSSLLGRNVAGFDALAGALRFLDRNRDNPRIANVVTKLINNVDLDDQTLKVILHWLQRNKYSPGVNVPMQAALNRDLIKDGNEEFGWLGGWSFQRRRHFGKNHGSLIVSVALKGFFRGEEAGTLFSIMNALETNRLRHMFLAANFGSSADFVEMALGEPKSRFWPEFWGSMIKWDDCPSDIQEAFYNWCTLDISPERFNLLGKLVTGSISDSWIALSRLPEDARLGMEPPDGSNFDIIY